MRLAHHSLSEPVQKLLALDDSHVLRKRFSVDARPMSRPLHLHHAANLVDMADPPHGVATLPFGTHLGLAVEQRGGHLDRVYRASVLTLDGTADCPPWCRCVLARSCSPGCCRRRARKPSTGQAAGHPTWSCCTRPKRGPASSRSAQTPLGTLPQCVLTLLVTDPLMLAIRTMLPALVLVSRMPLAAAAAV